MLLNHPQPTARGKWKHGRQQQEDEVDNPENVLKRQHTEHVNVHV